MKKTLLVFLLISQVQWVQAQDIAPNFVLTDIMGETHELYEYLDQGKSVVLDFYAVWCSPCQQNTTGVEAVWDAYGPNGTDEIMILGLEADDDTTDQEVLDYIAEWGGSNPQINNTGEVKDLYGIGYYPTYFIVCPDRTFLEYSGGPNTIETILSDGFASCATTGGYFDNDARIFDYNSNTTLCSDETTPSFTLMNMGLLNLSSVEVKTYLDGDLQSTTNWVGDLALYEFTDVTAPMITVPSGASHEITIVIENPNNTSDGNPQDNTLSVDVESGGEIFITNSVHFQLYFDNFPQETSWEILNSIGEVIYSGSDYQGYPDFSPPIDTYLSLPSDCYIFNIYDSVGDGICCDYADPGEGFWKFFTDGGELIAEGGTFTNLESAVFGIEVLVGTEDFAGKELKPIVYPNPAKHQVNITNMFDDYNWQIISFDGRICLNGISVSNTLNTIDISNLKSSGIYFLKIDTETQSSFQKIIIE